MSLRCPRCHLALDANDLAGTALCHACEELWHARQQGIARRCLVAASVVAAAAVGVGLLWVFPALYDVDPTLVASWIIMGLPAVAISFLVVFALGGLWIRRQRRRFRREPAANERNSQR